MIGSCTATNTPQTTQHPDGLTGRVTRVSDGDSIDVETSRGDITVRLVGINAPERTECFYEPSLDHLTNTVDNATVTLEEFGTDQFGRTLAQVFMGSRHVNIEMVNRGFAIAMTPEESDPYGTSILDAEEKAFQEGAGLWAEDACGPPTGGLIAIDADASTPNPPGRDDEVLGLEEITIVSQDDTKLDLSGWILRDESSRHRFRFRPGSTLDPGESRHIASNDPGWEPGGSPVWNNDGDMALLEDPQGNVVARWRY